MSFTRAANPIWFFNNLTGQPVDDTYYAFYLENEIPYNPQPVFKDINGTIPWSNPIEFQANAGLPDNIYFNPSLVYRIEIRQGPTQIDPLVYVINNFSPFGGSSSLISEDSLITSQNMITNPQFSDISFVSPITYTSAGTYDIGLGWKLILTGIGGSTTITSNASPGNSNITGNPPYFLTFASNGWTSVELIQTFSNNGAIFSGGACAIAFDAFSTTNPNILSVFYKPSSGSSTTLFNGSIPTGSSVAYAKATDIPFSTSIDSGINAFVNIVFTLPATGIISLSNIQLTGQSVPLSQGFLEDPTPPRFQEQTYERTVDQEFHLYKNSLLNQTKSNLLAGWTFPINPYQFVNPAISNKSNNQYIADQTILIQQNVVNSSVINNVATGRSTFAKNNELSIVAVTASNKFALIQYIDPTVIYPYWGQNLSSKVFASIGAPTSSTIKFKVKLIYRNNLPPSVTNNEPISSWSPTGEPVFAAGWTAISCVNDPAYTLSTLLSEFDFNKFTLPASTSNDMTLGIVIYTLDNMAISPNPDTIYFNRVSLVPNDFAIDAATETTDEALRKCQFYYEQSYNLAVERGTGTSAGANYFITALFNQNLFYKDGFSIQFKQVKRSTPIVTFYSPLDGSINQVKVSVWNGVMNPAPNSGTNPKNYSISDWRLFGESKARVSYRPINQFEIMDFSPLGASFAGKGETEFHYTADSRLGI